MNTRYVKFLIDAGYNDYGNNGNIDFSQVIIKDRAGNNIGLNKTATATPGDQLSGITNGDLSPWCRYGLQGGVGYTNLNGSHWLKIDLGSIMNVASITVYTWQSSGWCSISDFRIMVSNDDISYALAKTVTGVPRGGTSYSELNEIKFLIKSPNNHILTYDSVANSWADLGPATLTESYFKANGFSALPSVLKIQEVIPGDILYWTDDLSSIFSVSIGATLPAKLILAKNDINLASVEQINSMTLVSTSTANSKLKLILSNDCGLTYKSYFNGLWVVVDVNDINDVKAKGMDKAAVNSLTKAQILSIKTKTLRFGYLMDLDVSTSVLNTDAVSLNVDMKGSWDEAQSYVDYKAGYPNSSMINVRLLSNGDFKINY